MRMINKSSLSDGDPRSEVETRRLLGASDEYTSVADHRRRPALAVDHLGASQFRIAVRLCRDDDKFSSVAQRNQVAICQHRVAWPKAILLPLHLATRHGHAFDR